MKRPLIRASILLLATLATVGCEEPTKKPMNEPLTIDDALDASDRSQRDADALLRERQGDLSR